MTSGVQTGRVWRQQAWQSLWGRDDVPWAWEDRGCRVARFGRYTSRVDLRMGGMQEAEEIKRGIKHHPKLCGLGTCSGQSYQLPAGENGEEQAQGRRGSKMVQSHSGYIKCEKPAGHPSGEAQEVVRGTCGKQGRSRARDLNRPVSQEDTDVA